MEIEREILRVKDLESVSQGAKRVGVTPGYLYRLIKEQRLEAIDIGGKMMLRKEDVTALMRKRAC